MPIAGCFDTHNISQIAAELSKSTDWIADQYIFVVGGGGVCGLWIWYDGDLEAFDSKVGVQTLVGLQSSLDHVLQLAALYCLHMDLDQAMTRQRDFESLANPESSTHSIKNSKIHHIIKCH